MKTCLCRNRDDIRCDDEHCDIAGPGKPNDPNECRICWLRLGGDPRVAVQQAVPILSYGPGTELTKLLVSLGITSQMGCACKAKAREMDQWGVAGCRERRDEIADFLRDNAQKRSWWQKTKAAALAAAKGIAFELDLGDLYGSLVDLAIRRAEVIERTSENRPEAGQT